MIKVVEQSLQTYGRVAAMGVVDEPAIAEQLGAGQHSRVAGVRRVRVVAKYAVVNRCHLVVGVHFTYKGEDLCGVGSNRSPPSVG